MQAVEEDLQTELVEPQASFLVQITDMAPSREPKTVASVEVTINQGIVIEGIKVRTDGAGHWSVVLPATAGVERLRQAFLRVPELWKAIDNLIFRELLMEHHEWCHGPMEAYFYGRSRRGQVIVSAR